MIILNLVEDILDIIKDDERHTVKICVDTLGVTVYIDDDPEDMGEEKYVIPIRYDTLYSCCHIPPDEYKRCMKDDDTDIGIDKQEIDLIQKIMAYLENNSSNIIHYCDMLSQEFREDNNS